MPPSSLHRALVAVALIACAACGEEPLQQAMEPKSEPYVTTFDRMWTTVDQDYSYLQYKQVDWPAVRRTYRPRAAAARGTAELLAVVQEALSTLRDVHVWIVTPGGDVRPTWRPSHRANWGPALLERERQRSGWVAASDAMGGRSVGGVPYLALATFAPGRFLLADFDRWLARHRGASALVLDVRMNPGGSDALAYEVVGRFAAAPGVGGHYRFRNGWRHDAFTPLTPRVVQPRGGGPFGGRVVLLTGRGTFSAAEGFVAAMRTLPNVVVVGDTTGGGSGNPSVYPLREGYGFALSRWIEYTDDLQPIEGVGIAPDVVVPFTSGAVAAGEDETLRAGLALARARPVQAGSPR